MESKELLRPRRTTCPCVLAALQDDLNTPQAMVELDSLWERNEWAVLEASCRLVFGIDVMSFDLQKMLRESRPDIDDSEIQNLIIARNRARNEKNLEESDRIRDELLAKGIVLKDGPNGTTWEVKR